MSKSYAVTFLIKAPEGFDDEFDPYAFDNLFDDQGAAIEDVAIEVIEEDN
jgi:hypothetical protein